MNVDAINSGKTQKAVQILKESKSVVVLTGAGISTPSGIPDFRSRESGLWNRANPMEVASLSTFRHDPERFYIWFRPFFEKLVNAKPNPAHYALANLEKAGCQLTIITQNIDGLHQRAGSSHVIEVHGSIRTMTCTHCYQTTNTQVFSQDFVANGMMPQCPHCQSVLKPDVILMEEQLPRTAWIQAETACKGCDTMLIVGSSLEVMPVAGLPMRAIDHQAQIIVFNKTPTYLDRRAKAVISGNIARTLPSFIDQVMSV